MNSRKIPIYIVNLKKRKDRRLSIEKEFAKHPEFDVNIVRAIEHALPAIGLYRSLKKIVKRARMANLPFIIFCEDDHGFTSHYSFELFEAYLKRCEGLDADLFLGGVSWFDYSVPVDENLFG